MSARVGTASNASDATLNFAVIHARAKKLGISKGRLAEIAGVDYSTWWRYHRQGMKMSLDVATSVADALGLTVDEIRADGTSTGGSPPAGPQTPPPPSGPKAGDAK